MAVRVGNGDLCFRVLNFDPGLQEVEFASGENLYVYRMIVSSISLRYGAETNTTSIRIHTEAISKSE